MYFWHLPQSLTVANVEAAFRLRLAFSLAFSFNVAKGIHSSLSLLYQEVPNALPPMSVVHIQASYHIGSLSTKWQASFQIEASFALLPNRIDSSSDMLASSRSSDRDLVWSATRHRARPAGRLHQPRTGLRHTYIRLAFSLAACTTAAIWENSKAPSPTNSLGAKPSASRHTSLDN